MLILFSSKHKKKACKITCYKNIYRSILLYNYLQNREIKYSQNDCIYKVATKKKVFPYSVVNYVDLLQNKVLLNASYATLRGCIKLLFFTN